MLNDSVSNEQNSDDANQHRPSDKSSQTRRGFIKSSTALSAGVATGLGTSRAVRGAEPVESSKDYVRIGLVGAGGRGGGAINDTLTINDKIRVTAIADWNEDKPGNLRKAITKYGDKVSIDDSKLYGGIDGYKRILDDPSIDLVLFATPPGFRPQYVAEAVDAGKHVFAEKPTCVDPAGYKTCLWAHAKAESNGTSIVTGTQYRRQLNYREAIKRIHDGEIGDVISSTMRYCSNSIWYRPRKEDMSDTEYQIYNWMHFIWLSGDQIAEQAVHNVDTMNWVMGGPPESAYGSGGRFTRPDDSEMWDNIEVDFVYPGNRVCSFMCRQIPNTKSDNSNVIYGSKGICTIYGGNRGANIADRDGNELWSMKGDIGSAYKQEHKDLVDAILTDKPIVELKQTADSSLTAVMGRMAAYTGQDVTWDFVTNESELDLFPKDFDIDGELESPGHAVPGKTKLI
ncbi:MAG: Gfo/Idh/MocA family oxidoreductase [Pirellulaceae bacterium]|nr:Gfo/Idh/MocA family oxidoreductase [Pirellulaceae bacterium]